MTNKVIGSYRITQELGAGGMGAVYAAEHTLLGRRAAIKVLLPQMSREAEIVNRFLNEAKAASAIKHPGIVQIYDLGHQEDGSAYIAMEYLEGEGLEVRIRRLGRLPVQQALRFTGQIASALAAVHERRIYHRDLKPGNVFLVPDKQVTGGERIKLLDFGIAKLHDPDPGAQATRAGALMGSPSYMSPEQCRGAGEVDHRADLYSLGCILYEMLCGRPPFDGGGGGVMAILSAQLRDAPPLPSQSRPELTPEIDALVLGLMAKDPDLRPPSAAHLAHAITQLTGEQMSFAAIGSAFDPGAAPGADDDFGGATIVDMQLPSTLAATQPSQQTAQAATRPSHTGTGTGTGLGTGPHTSNTPLIEQLAGNTTGARSRRSTGLITGHVSDQGTSPTGNMAAAGQTRAGDSRVQTALGQRAGGSRRLLWVVVALLLVGGLSVALTQIGGSDKRAEVPTDSEQPEEPVVAMNDEPPPPPEPTLDFFPLAEEEQRRRREQPRPEPIRLADLFIPLEEGGGVNLPKLSIPSFTWGSVLSGNFFDNLVESITEVFVEPPRQVVWRIATEPAGAQVLRNGSEVVGTTEEPFGISLEETPGFSETFILRLDRYHDHELTLSGEEDFDEVVALEPKVYATVVSQPAGAEVLDAAGAVLGTTPLELELPRAQDEGAAAGKTVTLRMERFLDTPIELRGEQTFEEKVALPPRVYATVVSRPEGAEVLDASGAALGTTPLEIELMPDEAGQPTPQTVTLRMERYEDAELELAGERSFRETVRLEAKVFATVNSQPEGAQVVDAAGELLGTTPLEFELPRSEQPLEVTLKLDDHVDTSAVLRGNRSFTKRVTLRPLPRATLVSQPEGATIYDAAGQRVGTAPLELKLPGTGDALVYTMKLEGYRDATLEVDPRRGRKIVTKLSRDLGTTMVNISSEPSGAEVFRGNKRIGETPLTDEVPGQTGKLRYTLKLPGFQTRNIAVAGDENSETSVQLKRCAPQRRGTLGPVSVYGGC
ncbi:serine/threonine-protein kinase [Haliangium ochraceum]|uniref:Serine/threonine protein kinase n=1 Tax=Haliangium ochraceum (strain DSM 14365 / JCM 11303 / SMP-2) TaxID=502025 RepID=D0LWD9_HALO1|nr:serine/threonine-protein kinase [Haliangium ochraceum]ACY17589.1 serine/threonine protein kinase [Haliangium ochraceum DSM 14365]